MARPARLQIVSKEDTSDNPDTITLLPHGTRPLKIVLVPGEEPLPPEIFFAPLHRHANENVVAGHADDGQQDIWVAWGGGHPEGYRLHTSADERYIYFDVIHRGPSIRPQYDLTIVGSADGREVCRQTFHLAAPNIAKGAQAAHFAWEPRDENLSDLRLRGDAVPDYLSRWWASADVSYQPLPKTAPFPLQNILVQYERRAEDSEFGQITARWTEDADPFLTVDGRLEVSLYDTRLFSAELFHFVGNRYFILRLWFRWLHRQFSADDLVLFLADDEVTSDRREKAHSDAQRLNRLLFQSLPDEIPDAERFDVLLDVQTGRVLYAGTDLHWQEMWGPAPSPESVHARILPFGLQNLTYSVITWLQSHDERTRQGEWFDPTDTLRRWAEQGFPGQRGPKSVKKRKLSLPFQAHVPKYDGVHFLAALTSGNVKQSRPVTTLADPPREQNDLSPRAKAQWTVMIYMAGDNGILFAEPMESAGYQDLKEMKAVGSSDKVHILAQFDTKDNRSTYRYRLRADTSLEEDLVQTIGETDTGDPANLVDFVAWAMQQYPARHTMLILWNHGNGWDDDDVYASFRSIGDRLPLDGAEVRSISQRSRFRQALFRSTLMKIPREAAKPGQRGILYDDTSMDFLDNQELKIALAKAVQRAGLEQIDILGMDACLMAMLEVAYQVRASCRYFVASEEVEPMRGWPYDLFLKWLAEKPRSSPSTVAREAVSRYVKSYDRGLLSPDITISALDTTRLSALTAALDRLALALLERLHETAIFEAVTLARRNTQRFQHDGYIDLAHFLRLLLNRRPDDTALRKVVKPVLETLGPKRAVAANGTLGSQVENAEGVAIYFPERGAPPDDGLTALYSQLDFARDCHWPALLIHYHAAREAYYERRPLPSWQPPADEKKRRTTKSRPQASS